MFASVICSNVIYTVDEKGEESFHGKPWAKWTMNYLSRLHDSHHGALGTIGRSFFFFTRNDIDRKLSTWRHHVEE